MTYLPWRTKKTKADFRISVLNFIGGGIFFLGEKLGFFLRLTAPLKAPRKEGEKTLKCFRAKCEGPRFCQKIAQMRRVFIEELLVDLKGYELTNVRVDYAVVYGSS